MESGAIKRLVSVAEMYPYLSRIIARLSLFTFLYAIV